ncbi:glycosyltransferase involved in cell wall biosynthesis [Microbacterium endophyticum]|uniref:Glycosyltransferase involved in cell wall biosynthesis n=1 Tax=Microbacterium endophyticum TaxID=1526412 RepID=A0A7W4V3S6_9MICO|nr:glycosyltransferase family A protein [Microbacterium endophyticum]MBB2976352.1 glycosyltransferase involved in cell wall biosynthesis [Microbacterium endophyticum]NIK35232.1 glycosyltransferase involved in cell wall biosynthesis [Microbacterium endophyticum]
MTTPQVAIVVRTKDRPHFLRRAINSIQSQSFTDWECVVVNDGGDIKQVELVLASAATSDDPRIRILNHEESRGRWKSANAGVLGTTAPLLVLHDDDDSWHPEFLDRATSYLSQHTERDGVVARTEILWESRDGDSFSVERREIFQGHLQDLLLTDALLFNRFVPIGFLYRRELHAELGLYDDKLPVIGDWAFNLRVLARGPLEYLSDQALAYWHQRSDTSGAESNSVTGAGRDHDRFDARIRDSELRKYTENEGLGLVLYLTKFIDQRFVDVEAGIRHEIVDASFWNRLKQWLKRR